jgi:small subunit ribosomal protein S20
MANLKSSKKNIRKIERQTERNRQVMSRLKTLAKKVKAFLTQGDNAQAKSAAIEYVSALDKAAKRDVIHANRANRQKSVVSKAVFGA